MAQKHAGLSMSPRSTVSAGSPWYALFSRGARDWLRHNQKIRDSVQQQLPDLVASADLITGPEQRTVHLPVHILEHARFRLADNPIECFRRAGQGHGEPGDLIRPAGPPPHIDDADLSQASGHGESQLQLLLELTVDELVDWLWETMKLPELRPKTKTRLAEQTLVREGWDKHGARARLDRRRTIKEAVKRRAIQADPVAFCNDDLRFRPLVRRPQPVTHAVVLFALDVSASMTQAERKLAKTFFFFVLQGLRRKYGKVETRFIAHTTQAWEFSESEFFQVTGTGGTGASSAFALAEHLLTTEYPAAQFNSYLFYASDGENFTEDRKAASGLLHTLTGLLNYVGYIETVPGASRTMETEMSAICRQLQQQGAALGCCILNQPDDIWKAIRQFFSADAMQTNNA